MRTNNKFSHNKIESHTTSFSTHQYENLNNTSLSKCRVFVSIKYGKECVVSDRWVTISSMANITLLLHHLHCIQMLYSKSSSGACTRTQYIYQSAVLPVLNCYILGFQTMTTPPDTGALDKHLKYFVILKLGSLVIKDIMATTLYL